MRRTILSIIMITLSLFLFASCQDDIWTYDNPGTITIEITNKDISVQDVVVETSLDSTIKKTGNTITISQDQLIKNAISLSVEGYISKNIIVKSLDFAQDGTYSTKVEFEESYIFLELTVITDAPKDEIVIECGNILSYKSQGNIYEFKLSKDTAPKFNISAGESYQSQSFTLNQDEIDKGISNRSVMLLDNEHVMVVFNVGMTYSINYWYDDSNIPVQESRKGNQVIYAVNRNYNINFSIYDDLWQHVGEKRLTASSLSQVSSLTFGLNDLDLAIELIITPYNSNQGSFPSWAVIAEKYNDKYIPLMASDFYEEKWHVILTFAQDKEYYAFTMSRDGKIRYKEIDISENQPNECGNKSLEIVFNYDDTIQEAEIEIVDIAGDLSNFDGIEISVFNDSTLNDEILGIIENGNTYPINVDYCFHHIHLGNLPDGYEQYISYNNDHYYNLALQGVYKLYIYQAPIKLTVYIDSEESYEGSYIEYYDQSNWEQMRAYIDENNSASVDIYRFGDSNIQLIKDGTAVWEFNSIIQNASLYDFSKVGDKHFSITIRIDNNFW